MSDDTKLTLDASDIEQARKAVSDLMAGIEQLTGKVKELDSVATKTSKELDELGNSANKAKNGTKSFSEEIDRAEKALRGMGGGFGSVKEGFSAISEFAALNPWAVIGAGIGLATVAVSTFAIEMADAVDTLGDAAAKLGTNANQFLIYKTQLEAAGTSVDVFVDAQDKIAKALSKADDEGSKAAEALKTLGINATEASTPQQVLTELTEKYSEKLKDGSVSASELASLILVLGKNFREKIIAAQEAEKAQAIYNDMMQRGIGITVASQEAASQHEEAMNGLKYVMTAAGSIIAADVVPAFTALIGQFVDSYKNGGMVKGIFDAIRLSINLLMAPIKALIAGFIGIDTAITIVGKSVGALFAAIATKSLDPLRSLKDDIDNTVNDSVKRLEQLNLFSMGSDTTKLDTSGTAPGAAVSNNTPTPTTEPARKIESSAANELIRQEQALVKLRNEYLGFYGAQKKTNEAMLEAEIAMGKFNQQTDASGKVTKKAATEQELAALRAKAIARDRLEMINASLALEQKQYEQAIQTAASEAQRATAARQSVNEHRIEVEVMREYGTTQNDVNLALTDYNLKQIDSALAIATATNASEAEILVLKAKRDALLDIRDAQQDRKEIDDAEKERQRSFSYGWEQSFKKYTEAAGNSAKVASSMFGAATGRMEDAIDKFVMTGKFSFKDFTASILADIAKILAKQALIQGIKAAGTMFGFADGGAFSNGVQFFANGGVVDRPTAFAMSGGRLGVMGEAGSEAVMPLTRTSDGKMGVHAVGSGGGQVINTSIEVSVNIGSVDSNERAEQVTQAIKRQFDGEFNARLSNAIRNGVVASGRK